MESFIDNGLNNLDSSIDNLFLNKEDEIIKYKDYFFNTDNVGIEYYILKKLIDLDKQNINIILYLIEVTLELGDYNQANKYMSLVSNIKGKQLRYLQDKINEFSSSKNNYLNSYRKKLYIANMFNSGKYECAFFECDSYYECTKDKDFIFIKAKLLYLLSKYEEAKNLLIEYISIGKKFLLEANIYLFYIFNKLEQKDMAKLYFEEVYELFYHNDEFDISKFERNLLDLEINFNNNTLLKLKKSVLFNTGKYENSKQYINRIN